MDKLLTLIRIYEGNFTLKNEHQAIVWLMEKGLIAKYRGKNHWFVTAGGAKLVMKWINDLDLAIPELPKWNMA